MWNLPCARMAIAVALVCSCTGARPTTQRTANRARAAVIDAASDDSEEASEDAAGPEASMVPEEPALPEVVFEAVEPAAAPSRMPAVAIAAPRKGVVIPTAAAPEQELKLEVRGWELKDGKHVQWVLDNRAYVRVDDLKRTIKLRDFGPDAIGEGQHFVAALLARGNRETVKPAGRSVPAALVSFFVGKKTPPVWKEGAPILVYSAPQSGQADGELLVDFYVFNAQIAQGRTVVHLAVSGPGLRAGESLTQWTPWRIRNARPGLYAIQLALYRFEAEDFESESVTTVKYQSKPVPGPWTSVTREFTVTAPEQTRDAGL